MRKRERDVLLEKGPKTKIASQIKQDAIMSRWLRSALTETPVGAFVGLSHRNESSSEIPFPHIPPPEKSSTMTTTSSLPLPSPENENTLSTPFTTTVSTPPTPGPSLASSSSISPTPVASSTTVLQNMSSPAQQLAQQLTFHLSPCFSVSVFQSSSSTSPTPSLELSTTDLARVRAKVLEMLRRMFGILRQKNRVTNEM